MLSTLSLGVFGIVGSNLVLKNAYDRLDKSDPYWNYTKVSNEPFHHLSITGGNVTNIVYEESPTSFVKVLSAWRGVSDGSVNTHVKNDTLFLNFSNVYRDIYEKYWFMDVIPVRLSSPRLLTVNGHDTKIVIDKFNGADIKVNLTGNSKLQVNSYRLHLNRLELNQSDSSLITFTTSRQLFTPDVMTINEVVAKGSGTSLLNLRSSGIENLQLELTDSAAVALSGYSLDKWKKGR